MRNQMSPPALPTRLVICVDGTWCTPAGLLSNTKNNTTSNVYRIYASVKVGECTDNSGQKFIQKRKYIPGIGSQDDLALVKRLQTGIFGDESLKQIRDVYEQCCMLPGHPRDELWFYGFSRGAYVVRAIAGLLHYLRVLTSAGTPTFQDNYKSALKFYEKLQMNSSSGQLHSYFSDRTRAAPKIQFLGAFDTVKAVNDRSFYDISLNESIQHLRHALALNEDRNSFTPEYLFPELNRNELLKRSFIQAWFLGAHLDMGGSASKDGLSLYPLQWMLLESRSKGLVLEFTGDFGNRARIDNPLKLVLTKLESDGKGADLWSFTAQNGIVFEMQDLRKVHDLPKYAGRYNIYLNRCDGIYWTRTPRQPFNTEGELQGYCNYAPQGTIVHPSVYLITDLYRHVYLNSKKLGYLGHIDQWRNKVLPDSSREVWDDQDAISIENPGPLRILVCGNTAVGKSSLINEVFGTPVTIALDRERGNHNIWEPLTTTDRLDLLIHDSGGFEAGGLAELETVKKFVSDLSAESEIAERLHLIWFCIELGEHRTRQTGTRELFKTISKYAKDVPIVIVATKKDKVFALKAMEARQAITREGKSDAEYIAALDSVDKEAEIQCANQLRLIESELRQIDGGRFDAAVAISKNDKGSIDHLTEITLGCFNHEKVRLLYIASQVTRIDLKVEAAIMETMRIYKHTVRSALAASFVPGGASFNRLTVASIICRAIVQTCFGIPTVSPETVREIVNANIWEDMGQNFTLLIVEGVGVLGTVLLGGMPVFLAPGVINAPLAVPATTRLFLTLACDMILILVRAFKISILKCLKQPLKKDIEKAAHEYREISDEVHKRIRKLIPRSNMMKSFQVNRIRAAFGEIIGEYKVRFTEGIGEGVEYKFNGVDIDSDDTDVEDEKGDFIYLENTVE